MEAYIGSKQTISFPQGGEIQNGDTGNYQDFQEGGVGDLNMFQGRLLLHTNTGTVQEIFEISCPGSDIPIQSTALWSVHSTHGVYCASKGGQADGHTQGYKNPPRPRRLVGESQIPPGLSPTYTRSGENVSGIGLTGELREIRTGTQAGFQLRRLPVRPQVRSCPIHTGPVAEPARQNTETAIPTSLSCPGVHVLDRFINSHRKASSSRPIPYETHKVAFEKQLEGTGISREGDPNPQVPAPPFTMVARRRQCWFSVRYAAAAARREIFGINTLRGK